MQRSHVEARQALRLRAHPPLCGISPWLEEQFDHAGEKRKGAIAVKQKTVIVNDRMQQGYRYVLVAPTGRNFEQDFRPDLSPPEMLRLGIFGGKYMTDCKDEFPHSWFAQAKLSPKHADTSLNYFGVDSSQSLSVWRKKGWIYPDDPRGWFQWYCRYYLGRRLPAEDARQIRRWKAIRRHVRQLQMNCEPGDISCRKRQRQALLHWAYDSRKL
jgi:hypothetical protein